MILIAPIFYSFPNVRYWYLFASLSLCVLGGWLSVYAAICRAPYWGPTFYCIDRCRYSLPFWPAAAGERSVSPPVTWPGSHFHPVWRWAVGGGRRGSSPSHTPTHLVYLVVIAPPFLFLSLSLLESCLAGVLPALAKGQTVTCLVSRIFCQSVTRVSRDPSQTHTFPAIGVCVFPLSVYLPHYATTTFTPVTPDLGEMVNKWHQRPNGKEPVVVRGMWCHGLWCQQGGFWVSVTCFCRLFMRPAQKSTDD